MSDRMTADPTDVYATLRAAYPDLPALPATAVGVTIRLTWRDVPIVTLDVAVVEPMAMAADPLVDPDCKAGKHGSCVGGPCECECHMAGVST